MLVPDERHSSSPNQKEMAGSHGLVPQVAALRQTEAVEMRAPLFVLAVASLFRPKKKLAIDCTMAKGVQLSLRLHIISC
ncbi:Tyrosine-Protein Kinase Fes/Fps [Manis pentadactyla]|nr:Tyrosine-Protein Kinase Fes/Fps [Manis pentadactyla]